ncbi:hypothetical protein B0H11DRAFT_2214536 [Mycena galericulata]|nr:hypothetical protein B0H11DRAFT_2214536 [Mycena galericulata]
MTFAQIRARISARSVLLPSSSPRLFFVLDPHYAPSRPRKSTLYHIDNSRIQVVNDQGSRTTAGSHWRCHRKNAVLNNPTNTVFDVKRLIARQFDNSKIQPGKHFYLPVLIGAASPTSLSSTAVNKKKFAGLRRSLRCLRTACELANGTLSSAAQTFLELDSVFTHIDFYTSLTHAHFEELSQDTFRSTLEPVDARDPLPPTTPLNYAPPPAFRAFLPPAAAAATTLFSRDRNTLRAMRACPGPGESRAQSSAARMGRLSRTEHKSSSPRPALPLPLPPLYRTSPASSLRDAPPPLTPTRGNADKTRIAHPCENAAKRGTERIYTRRRTRTCGGARLHGRDEVESDADGDSLSFSPCLQRRAREYTWQVRAELTRNARDTQPARS